MFTRSNIASVFFITTVLFSAGAKSAEDPNTLCAFGYIKKINASISGTNEDFYMHRFIFDTQGFVSPRNTMLLTLQKSAVDGSTYQGLISSEATELMRNAFTSHRPVRVFTTSNKLSPTYCSGGPTEFKIEICSDKECSG